MDPHIPPFVVVLVVLVEVEHTLVVLSPKHTLVVLSPKHTLVVLSPKHTFEVLVFKDTFKVLTLEQHTIVNHNQVDLMVGSQDFLTEFAFLFLIMIKIIKFLFK